MSKLNVAQFDVAGMQAGNPFMLAVPPLHDDVYDVPASGAQLVTPPFDVATVFIRVVCDGPLHLCFDEAPESDQGHMVVPANLPTIFKVKTGHSMAAVVSNWRSFMQAPQDPSTA